MIIQSLELTQTDFPYEIYLDWTRLYVVIVVHSLIISQNYTQLDADMANAEHELDGEEAAADPAKRVVLNSF